MGVVVEGPRRSKRAPRRVALCLGLSLSCISGTAWSAGCIPASDLVALRTSALRQQLMVAALQCNRVDQFNHFIRSYDGALRTSDAVLLNFFKKRNAITGTADYNSFKTSLANLWAVSSSKDNNGFCSDADTAFRMAANPKVVPLNAIAANIPTGRYVACAPDLTSQTTVAAAEPVRPIKPVVQTADVRPAPVRVAEATPTPKPAPMRVAEAAPVPKPAAPQKVKPAMAVAIKTPSVAAGPGIPLSQYAANMGKVEDAAYQRGPYESTPEELMTEADLPDATNAPPIAAPSAKVAKSTLPARTAPMPAQVAQGAPRVAAAMAQSQVAEVTPRVASAPVQPQIADAVVPRRVPAPVRSMPQQRQMMAQADIQQDETADAPPPVTPDDLTGRMAPAPRTARVEPAQDDVADSGMGPEEAAAAERDRYMPRANGNRQPEAYATRDDYTPQRGANDNDDYYDQPAPNDDRYMRHNPYTPQNDDRYGNADRYRDDSQDQRDYQDRYYQQQPRYNQQPRRVYRERYAYAPDYADQGGDDGYGRDSYDPRGGAYYDPYYGR
jgi:hypothetical protein